MDIGDRIRELLAKRGMTIKGLSELSKVPQNTLYALTKKDGAKTARKGTLNKVAAALGVTTDYLLTGKETHWKDIVKDESPERRLSRVNAWHKFSTDKSEFISYIKSLDFTYHIDENLGIVITDDRDGTSYQFGVPDMRFLEEQISSRIRFAITEKYDDELIDDAIEKEE